MFGAHIPEPKKTSVKPGEQVKQADEATFVAALRRSATEPGRQRADRCGRRPQPETAGRLYPPGCAALHVGARSDAPLPERCVPRARTRLPPRLDARVRRRGGSPTAIPADRGSTSARATAGKRRRRAPCWTAMAATSSCRLISAASRTPSRRSPTRSTAGAGAAPSNRFLDLLGRGEGHAVAGACRSGGRADQAVKRRTEISRACSRRRLTTPLRACPHSARAWARRAPAPNSRRSAACARSRPPRRRRLAWSGTIRCRLGVTAIAQPLPCAMTSYQSCAMVRLATSHRTQ